MPVLFILIAYAVNYGYYFIVAANLASASRIAAEYSVQGYQGPAQTALPAAGPFAKTDSVASLAVGGLSNLLNSSTTTTVTVCSKVLGMNGNLAKCSSYGPAGTSYSQIADPEAPTFVLHRVDVTYTVHPLIPLGFFGYSLAPNQVFHRQVSMRAMD